MYGKTRDLEYLFDRDFIGKGLDPNKHTELEDILVRTEVDHHRPVKEKKRLYLYAEYG